MVSTTAPFTLQQVGTGTSRFPSGVALPTLTDASVDPYIKTRPIKTVQVECIEFWPQEKGPYPGIVLLHEWWGLNSQIKDLGARLACEGYGVIIPNLYGRIGGMVTGNAEVAEALMGKLDESLALQDINSCCEFLNTREFIKRNIHGVVGFGMGGTLAMKFACQRKRLKGSGFLLWENDTAGHCVERHPLSRALSLCRPGFLGLGPGHRAVAPSS